MNPRVVLVADTAIALLAERGMRGLTHRAVDEAAALPPGTTSNHARTRAALLELTLARLVELENPDWGATGEPVPLPAADDIPRMMAATLHHAITERRPQTIARYELALEATRRPELRAVYDEIGRRLRANAVAVFTAAGSADPVRHGHQAVAFAEGLLFDAVAGAGP